MSLFHFKTILTMENKLKQYASAAGELSIDEDGASIFGIGVLGDDRALNVVLSFSQLFHHLRVEIGLRVSVRCRHQQLPVTFVLVLTGLPDL